MVNPNLAGVGKEFPLLYEHLVGRLLGNQHVTAYPSVGIAWIVVGQPAPAVSRVHLNTCSQLL